MIYGIAGEGCFYLAFQVEILGGFMVQLGHKISGLDLQLCQSKLHFEYLNNLSKIFHFQAAFLNK